MKGIAFYEEDFFTIKRDYDLYAEEIRRLIMTGQNERPGQPFFGCNLRAKLFSLADDATANEIKQQIIEQVNLFLPMLEVTDLDAEIENNSMFVKLRFLEKGDPIEDERLLTVEFENVGEMINE